MEFSFMMKVHAAKETVWEYYSDIQKWYTWESDLKNITLDHEFKTGSKGVMELEGMPPMEYLLTSVIDGQSFWDRTDTPMGAIYFGHEIIESQDDFVSVRHTVRLESDIIDEERLSFLKQVFSDVPDSIMLLKRRTEEG